MNDHQSFALDTYHLSPELKLALLTKSDAAEIAIQLTNMEPWQSLGFTAMGLARYLVRIDPNFHCYCVFVADKLAGVIAVRYPWLRGSYLELLAIFTEYQKHGIGKQLIAWLVHETAKQNANVWTTVSNDNNRAHHFYLQNGFLPIGDIPDLIQLGCHETLLRLPITLAESNQT
ncbi:GNAT family N-acetyltransferase [Chromatium okenii]|jgi:ribosomal protein S18 acetylase RimI-like enzyme|uniref:N-acetyltransferase domain-containing protein n=1 Tax=Chromatium okenii TaxID=61644 RepID=A0A2S7XRA1_9GAMM|nr:GNAT family N-acetyltransferase [Chromatium okenii]PQJ96176.1 hypothetical protein CXB77_10265 [Chromatium okenii]